MNSYDILKMVSEMKFSEDQVQQIKHDFKEAERDLELKARSRRVDQELLSKSYGL